MITLAMCGDYNLYDKPVSDPWDPCPRKEGSGSGMMPPPPPMCDVSERRCDYEFLYKGMGG